VPRKDKLRPSWSNRPLNSRKGIPHKNAIYPYANWFERAKKEDVKLVRGKDYKCRTASIAQQIRNKAWSNRLSISISIASDEDSLTMRVVKELPAQTVTMVERREQRERRELAEAINASEKKRARR
jgi:hypothetical protein